jgi:dTDP-4-dehydrorhamnose 3,5-epimerase
MQFLESPLQGCYIINPNPFEDNRGWFMRTFCKTEFEQIGHQKEWVQHNHSFTTEKGTIRGMHYQPPPYQEIKLVRCIAGVVYDVVVDIRKSSPTFLQWFGVELSAENKKSLYIPEGFAHGFQTLSHNAELIYLHSEKYQSGAESAIHFKDPLININWPLPVSVISERDHAHPLLVNFDGI